MLFEFLLANAGDLQIPIKDDCPRGGGALIDRKNIAGHRMRS
jgi:hypothetical protein